MRVHVRDLKAGDVVTGAKGEPLLVVSTTVRTDHIMGANPKAGLKTAAGIEVVLAGGKTAILHPGHSFERHEGKTRWLVQ